MTEVVSQLRSLRSLHLCIVSPGAVAANATCVGRLSTLTALTHLHLVLPDRYAHHGYSWEEKQQERGRHAALCETREEHRIALLSALRAMHQLQHLHCPTLWLLPGELAALTSPTSITLGGLLAPAVEHTLQHNGDPGRASGGQVAVPPQLRELELLVGVSPRALVPLNPLPRSLTRAVVPAMRFGTADVDEAGRLTAEAVAAVGPAMQLLAAYGAPHSFRIEGDGGPGRLLPRDGSPNGHMEWIRQLHGLDTTGSLKLRNVALRTGDICCLAKTLPGLNGKLRVACASSSHVVPAHACVTPTTQRFDIHRRAQPTTSCKGLPMCLSSETVVCMFCP